MSRHGAATSTTRAVLALPVPSAQRAADLCALAGVPADVVPVPGLGCAALLRDGAAGPAEDAAAALSRLLRRAEVVLLLAAGAQVTAQRWTGGARGEDPRAGLLLTTWPDEVAALLLGRLDPVDAPGAAGSTGRGRWRSLRSLLRAARGRRG